MNNLHGGAQLFRLPQKDFELDWRNINPHSDYGYIVVVDLIHPKEIQDLTKYFTLCHLLKFGNSI